MPTTNDFIQNYGPDWTPGLLVDHVPDFLAQGGTLRITASGRRQVALGEKGRAFPVVCGEIIEVWTEDGPTSGRCGLEVKGAFLLACEGHARQIEGWRSQTEAETVAWERQVDAR